MNARRRKRSLSQIGPWKSGQGRKPRSQVAHEAAWCTLGQEEEEGGREERREQCLIRKRGKRETMANVVVV